MGSGCGAGCARTLGIHITVAVKWQRAAAGDWAAYAADVSPLSGQAGTAGSPDHQLHDTKGELR